MTEHRGASLGTLLPRFADPERSRDPRIRAVVAQLRAVDPADLAPAPRREFRDELRAQLVAVAPRVISESSPDTPPGEARGALEQERRRHLLARPLALAGALLAAVLVLGGGLTWYSQRALPGDALYGLKRASESFQLAMASSDSAKAGDYLEFAGTRVDEATSLVERGLPSATGVIAAGRVSPATASLVRSALGSADSDVRSASQLLGAQAVRTASADPLATMTSWAPGQLHRLRQLAAMLPGSPLHARTLASAALVHRAAQRAAALRASVGCACLRRADNDQLGPVPCAHCARRHAAGPGSSRHHSSQPGRPGPGVRSGPSSTGGAGQPGTTRTHPGGSGSHGSNGGTGGGSAPNQLPTLPLPSLPVPSTPSLPLPTGPSASLPKLPLPSLELPHVKVTVQNLPLPGSSCGLTGCSAGR